MNKKSLLPVVMVPSVILLIPAAAMLLKVEGWKWDVADFVVAWVLIAGTILTYKLVTRKAVSRDYRIATGLAVAAGLILIWINGAVGLIGSEDNPANLMYAGVLAIGVIGAMLSRLEPLGMAWALLATAVAQFMVPVIAVMIWRPDFSPGVVGVFVLNGFFVMMFGGAAWLFGRAADGEKGAGAQRASH